MRVHCARTYGCVKLIEEALKRPQHRPKARMVHLADEYAALGGKDAATFREIGQELRRPWMRYLIAPVSPAPLGRDDPR